MSSNRFVTAVAVPLAFLLCGAAFAQQGGRAGAAVRDLPPTSPPPLFFREQWRQATKADGSIETAAFRDARNYVDLTGLASIKWNTKVSGMHAIHPAVRLADGTWLVGDQVSGSTVGWLEDEIAFSSMKWLRLDPERAVTTGNWIEQPDLSRVDEVGFVDLIPGSGHGPGGWSDVAQVEVYGVAIPRE